MRRFTVDTKLVERYLESAVLSGVDVARLLRERSISDGTPIYLDDETMMPIEPLCSWGRNMAYAELSRTTMQDYGRIMARFAAHQASRGRDVVSASESDLVAYRRQRTQLQRRPIGVSAWHKESVLLDQFYKFLEKTGHRRQRPVRVAARGRNPLSPRLRRAMDIRHLTLEQYRYFRDVGLGGQRPDARIDRGFRGWAPHRNRAGADLALGTGMRWQEWATVLLPELGIGTATPGTSAEFTVQACAKYGKARGIYVPEESMRSVETYLLLERPELTAAAATTLERRHRELFVVSRLDRESGLVHGVQDGEQHVFALAGMPPSVRRITVHEGEFGLEALAVFVCRGGLMPGADSWKRYRHAAWRRMVALADESAPRLPGKRWRWHDLRHTHALQLLTYLERQLEGAEPDPTARQRRHLRYLTEHVRRNPLLIVSRRLGHSSPEVTYAYLEYTDDLINEFEEAFSGWIGDQTEDVTYAQIAAHAFALDGQPGQDLG